MAQKDPAFIALPPSDDESSSASNQGGSSVSGGAEPHPSDDGSEMESENEILGLPTTPPWYPCARPNIERLLEEGFGDVDEVMVKIGEEIHNIPQNELLHFFWTDRPGTPCMTCGGDFNDNRGPPIRTYSLHSIGLQKGEDSVKELSKLIVEQHNRHLDCVQSGGIQFLPVSHVWHQEVNIAHQSKETSRNAVALTWFVPVRILNSATRTFREYEDFQHVEIWHDYLSVPQWNYDVQQQLLLYLPVIYKAAPVTLIHLDDVTESHLVTAFDRNASVFERYSSMMDFLVSHWFRRLWVAIEYVSSTQSCLMIEEARIIRKEGNTPLNSFAPLLVHFQQAMNAMVINQAPGFVDLMYNRYTHQGYHLYIGFRHGISPKMSLGEIYNLLYPLECRNYRDRFIAIIGLLSLGDYTQLSRQLPADGTGACFWVSWKCMERGDPTPLLLVPTGETEVAHARWLRGHEKMTRFMWTCGLIEQTESLSIIHNGRIEPELEYVGIIEDSCYVGFSLRKEPLDAFEIVVTFLLAKGEIFNAEDLVNALFRIYAVPPYITKDYPQIPTSFKEYFTENPNFQHELDSLILAYIKYMPDANNEERLNISRELARKLRFDEVYAHRIKPHTRVKYACTFADSKYYYDCIARVRCQGCKRAFDFRVALYKKYKVGWVGQKVYRIPGLSCEGFPGNGMCLIMAGTLIRGRSTYGVHACECRIRERVLVE